MIVFKLLPYVNSFHLSSQRLPSCGVRLYCHLRNNTSSFLHGKKAMSTSKLEQREHLETVSSVSGTDEDASRVVGIVYEQRELLAYHRILEKLPVYRNSIFTKSDLNARLKQCDSSCAEDIIRRDWTSNQNVSILDAFHTLTSYAVHHKMPISDDSFSPFCTALYQFLESCSDEELLEVGILMTLWPPAENTHARNFQTFFKTYDCILKKRYPKWFERRDFSTILKLMDTWFWLRLGKLNHFVRLSLFHILQKAKEPHHIIQLMFYLTLMNSLPMTYKAYDIEKKLYKIREFCSLEEMGCAVYGLFRSKSRLQHRPLILSLLKGLLTEAESISPLILCGLCKALKLSVPREYRPAIKALQKKLIPRIPDLPVEVLMAVVWLASYHVVPDDKFLFGVYLKLINNMDEIRIKDLTRFLTVCCEYKPKDVDLTLYSEKLLKQLDKIDKISWLSKKDYLLGSALHRLLLNGVFPKDHLDTFFKTRTSVKNSIAALGLDVHIEMFYPNYDGARLCPKLQEEVYLYRFTKNEGEKYVYPSEREGKASVFNTKLLQQVEGVLLPLVDGRRDCFYQAHTVPSCGFADLILCVDGALHFHPIPDDVVQIPIWKLKRIPQHLLNKELHLVALSFPLRLDEIKMTCFNSEKQKILKMLGYKQIEVDLHTWKKMSLREQQIFILESIEEVINDKDKENH